MRISINISTTTQVVSGGDIPSPTYSTYELESGLSLYSLESGLGFYRTEQNYTLPLGVKEDEE